MFDPCIEIKIIFLIKNNMQKEIFFFYKICINFSYLDETLKILNNFLLT